jgi:hypothetical protein
MKVTLDVILDGKNTLSTSAEVETFADLSKLGKKLVANVAGVRKLLPDLAGSKVVKVSAYTE